MASPGRKRKPSVQTSHALELAHYRRELAAQKRSYDELYRETERLRGALDGKDAEGLRIKNKALERKRELELAQRTIEGLRNEIRAAESQAKAAREYSRNIERKVAGGSYPKILAENLLNLLTTSSSSSATLSLKSGDPYDVFRPFTSFKSFMPIGNGRLVVPFVFLLESLSSISQIFIASSKFVSTIAFME